MRPSGHGDERGPVAGDPGRTERGVWSEDADHEDLIGLGEGREVHHPHPADVARRLIPDQLRLVDSSKACRPVERKPPNCRPWHSVGTQLDPPNYHSVGPGTRLESRFSRSPPP